MSLAGAHALVTGGGTGIGAAVARTLADAGARLTLVGRRRETLDAVAGEIGAAVAAADVSKPDQVAAAFEQARAMNGSVTILVNNAGIATAAPFDEMEPDDWRRIMAVNADALFYCCQAALSDLKQADTGRIVTIASTAGLKGYAYTAAYAASKHAAIGLTRALAIELAATNVTVNAVCPGFTDTAIVDAAAAAISARTGRDGQAARAALARFNPQGRLIDPQEIADAVLWLCAPERRSVTGQAIAIAGGEVM